MQELTLGKWQKKPGGQPGHEVKTLEMASIPDEIVAHNLLYCNQCGLDMSYLCSTMVERRQVVEIQPIKPTYFEQSSSNRPFLFITTLQIMALLKST